MFKMIEVDGHVYERFESYCPEILSYKNLANLFWTIRDHLCEERSLQRCQIHAKAMDIYRVEHGTN